MAGSTHPHPHSADGSQGEPTAGVAMANMPSSHGGGSNGAGGSTASTTSELSSPIGGGRAATTRASSSAFSFLKMRRAKSADAASSVGASPSAIGNNSAVGSAATTTMTPRSDGGATWASADSGIDGGIGGIGGGVHGIGGSSSSRKYSSRVVARRAKRRWRQIRFTQQKAERGNGGDAADNKQVGAATFDKAAAAATGGAAVIDDKQATATATTAEAAAAAAVAVAAAAAATGAPPDLIEHDRGAMPPSSSSSSPAATTTTTAEASSATATAKTRTQTKGKGKGKGRVEVKVVRTTRRTTTYSLSSTSASADRYDADGHKEIGGQASLLAATSSSTSASSSSSCPPPTTGDENDNAPPERSAAVSSAVGGGGTGNIDGSSSSSLKKGRQRSVTVTEQSRTERTMSTTSTNANSLVSILHHSFVRSMCWPTQAAGGAVDLADDSKPNGEEGKDHDRRQRQQRQERPACPEECFDVGHGGSDNIDSGGGGIGNAVGNIGSSGGNVSSNNVATHDEKARLQHRLSDIEDPTVQESIECVFAHQLEDEGLDPSFFFDFDEEEEDEEEDWDGDGNEYEYECGNDDGNDDDGEGGEGVGEAGEEEDLDAIVAPLSRSGSRISSPGSARVEASTMMMPPHHVAVELDRARSSSSDADLMAAARRSASDDLLGVRDGDNNRQGGRASPKASPALSSSRGRKKKNKAVATTTPPPLPKAKELTSRTWSRKFLEDSKSLVFIGTFGHGGGGQGQQQQQWQQESEDEAARRRDKPDLEVRTEERVRQQQQRRPAPPPSCSSCLSGKRHAPASSPRSWPQAPLMLRPTPGTGMRIRGVRWSGSDDYLQCYDDINSNYNGDSGGDGNGDYDNDDGEYDTDSGRLGTSSLHWAEALKRSWHGGDKKAGAGLWNYDGGGEDSDTGNNNNNHDDDPAYGGSGSGSGRGIIESSRSSCCHECAAIPVNNGNEATGRSLVVDFESPLFVGTLLMRIRNSTGTTASPYDDSVGYFAGMNRRYQAVIRGMFREDGIPMTECVTGQVLSRECGKLPPKLLLKGAVKVISFFAPRLETKLDGPRPTCISPLGSTPQVLSVDRGMAPDPGYRADQTIELVLEEPGPTPSSSSSSRSLLSEMPNCPSGPSDASTSIARARARKKAFDKLYADEDKSLTFRTDAVYTFEFLQHLIDFDDFGVDLGSVLGKVMLKDMLDGQPLKFLAARKLDDGGNGGKKKKGGIGNIALEPLWSFDIFHECLFDDAVRNDDDDGQQSMR